MPRVFIIASGPSLTGFDFHQLDNDITIGINYIYKFYTPTILQWNDLGFYRKNKEEINAVKCIKVTKNTMAEGFIGSGAYLAPIDKKTFNGKDGLKKGLYTDFLTGLSAISLAVALGLKPIYLLGFDCAHKDKRGHFYAPGINTRGDRNAGLYLNAPRRFDQFAKEPGIYDCSLEGRLTVFPKISIDDILKQPAEPYDKAGTVKGIEERLVLCLRKNV